MIAAIQDVSWLQLGILLGYFAMLISIAFVFRRMNSDGANYFKSGSQGTWWLVGMSTFMASFSAYTFTGLAGACYLAGFSATTNFLANVIGFAFNGLFFAAWARQMRVTTTPDVIRDRFGSVAEQIYSWVGNLFGILYSAVTLYTLCIFASAAFGFPLIPSIVIVGVVVMTYSVLGGRWAVMGADFVQGMILVPVTILLSLLCLKAVGGVDGLIAGINQKGLWDEFAFFKEPSAALNNNFTAPWVLATTLALLMDRVSMYAAPRYLAARDGRHAAAAGWLVAGLMAMSVIVFFLPPIVARLMFEADVNAVPIPRPAEASYAVISAKLLPEPLMGMMIVAIFSATLSTMDSGLNIFSANFVTNIYPAIQRWRRKPVRTDAAVVRLGEALTFVSGALIIAIACAFASAKGKGAFDFMLEFGALLGVPMSVPLTLGLFFKRVPSTSALWSLGCGFLVSLSTFLINRLDSSGADVFSYDQKVFSTLAAGVFGFFVSHWLSKDDAPTRARVAEFFQRMKKPVDFEREVGSTGQDKVQCRLLGWFCVAVGSAVLLLGFAVDSWGLDGVAGIGFISLIELGVGSLLLRHGYRK